MRKKKTTSKRKELSRYELRKRKEAALHRKRSKASHKAYIKRKYNQELNAIEKLLGEEFETLAEARRALREEEKKESDKREWMILIDYRKGKHPFYADLWMISMKDADSTQLADQARKQLSSGKKFLANWFEGAWSEITQGTLTDERKQTRIRSFHRHR